MAEVASLAVKGSIGGATILEVINGSGVWGFPIVLSALLFWLALPVFVVWGVIAIYRNSKRDPSAGHPDPELILKERLARGEIQIEEYERLRDLIRSGR